jgi:hypothetical protein
VNAGFRDFSQTFSMDECISAQVKNTLRNALFLGYCAASNSLPTFRDNISLQS